MPVLNFEQAVLDRGIIPTGREDASSEREPVVMWRLDRRVQMGVSLTLGVLASIALLSIPALLSPANQASTADTEGLTSVFTLATRSTEPETSGPASTTTSDKLSLGLGLFLLLLPASVLSFLTRKWAVRKLQQY